MNRLKFIILVFVFFSCNSQTNKNVLLIIVDDLKPTLSCYGNSDIITPNFDKLASKSVVFTNNHAQQAVCAPSRISLMTGMRPDYTQILDLKRKMRDQNPDILTIPQSLKKHGYKTIGIGKVFHGAKKNDPISWTTPFVTDASLEFNKNHQKPADGQYQNPNTHKTLTSISNRIPRIKNIRKELSIRNARPATECIDLPDNAYIDGTVTTKAIDILKQFQKKETPFFMTVGFRKPHLPFTAPKKYWDLYSRDSINIASYQKPAKGAPDFALHSWGELKGYSDIPKEINKNGILNTSKQKELIHGYYACVSYIDAQLGKILNYLESSKLEKNTLVILIGDHGWHLGDHGVWNKHTNYEQATRTPLFIMHPEGKKDLKNTSPTELIDLFPTICDYLQIKKPQKLQGTSLEPIILGERNSVKNAALSQYPRHNKMGYALRTNQFRYIEWREGNYKINKNYIKGKILGIELYDYKKDPLETTNLSGQDRYKKCVKKLKIKLDSIIGKNRVPNISL
ncbi:MAG: sulfatase [Flavicella sp.]